MNFVYFILNVDFGSNYHYDFGETHREVILLEVESEAEDRVGGGVGVVLHCQEGGGGRGLVDVPLESGEGQGPIETAVQCEKVPRGGGHWRSGQDLRT